MIKLGECTHLDAARLARNARCVILLPLGAVEEHGPHLPLLVDWLGAEELARRIAPHLERAGLTPVLAPSLPYGVSTLAAEWPGTVSLSRALVTRLIVEVVRALARARLPELRARQLPGRSRSSGGHGRGEAHPHAGKKTAGGLRRLRPRSRRQRRHGESARAPAAPQPAPGVGMAFRRARDGHGAGYPTQAGESLADAYTAPRLGGFSRGRSIEAPAASARSTPGRADTSAGRRAARAETAIKVMRLRGRLIAAEVIRALGPLPRKRRKRR